MQKTIAGLIIFLVLSGCDKKSVDRSTNYLDGEIIFRNATQYTVVVNQMVHKHTGETRIEELNRILFPGDRYQLINLFTGEVLFPGGDRVTVDYISQATDPNNPQSPLFSNVIFLIVNGTTVIRIKGEGDYDIGGG